MSTEDGEMWKAYKEHQKERKYTWRVTHFLPMLDKIKKICKEKGYDLYEFGNGHRRIALGHNWYIDFWETGTVRSVPTVKGLYTVENIIEYISQDFKDYTN